ncbi:helix-turn-helix domain-containing protein [Clostridium formicaceticum]|uniref:DNA-binding transcriptional repressor PuuR n=1 Tax=Clostridium formicaceticum TaxID=1497 RepID=A0AAC9RKM2_9CLOT|nr:helix-turn-helix transcriptional regulator [Clostridium formicaceticum]AOY76660.1 transcriptional regulator [Clostridium formicaceticum]ARE87085.1 DNA-binding transcriptional repressor PuuR [Clostridium formicaceticum]
MDKQEKKKIIGRVISDKRQSKKLTQLELSELTGLSRNYICDIENGRYMPSLDALTKLALPLNIDLNFLLSMTEIQFKY